jgi:diguanylate cyclase (GGDEF)-like protein
VHSTPYFNALDDPDIDDWSRSRLIRLGKESDVGLPIVTEGETWGEVYATTAPGRPRFRAEDFRFLEAVAGQIAIAIGRAELFSRVSRLAYEDPLTGLANRRAVEERLDRATRRANERRSPLVVVLCDLDDLKSINDTRGHAAGDRALRLVGDALVAASARLPGSMVGRLSGDEFCVVLEGAGLEAAREVAAATLGRLAGGPAGPAVSVSCGAAVHGAGVESPAELLRAADAALYRAKRSGGGQLFTAASGTNFALASHDRRTLRRSFGRRVRTALEEATRRLDGELSCRPALDRIEAVAVTVSEALNAAAWAVSYAPTGEGIIRTVSLADDRDRRLKGLRLAVDNDAYPLGDYQRTVQLLEAGAGTFVAGRDDIRADPGERALLQQFNRQEVLAATAADADGAWLLELYGDSASAPLAEGELALSLLMRAAIPPRSLAARRTGGHERRPPATDGLSARLMGETDREVILDAAADEIARLLPCDACAIVRMRADGFAQLTAGRGRLGEQRWRNMVRPADAGLIGRCLREERPVLAGDVNREPDHQPSPATRDMRSELDVPVWVNGDCWGAITAQDGRSDAFDQDDVELLLVVADQLGAALGTAAVFEHLERAYLGTAQALSAALEAKDSYTAAHSHAIVLHAEAVGRRLGMSAAELRAVRYAAAFHDIGKLAVSESLLNKPGPLDPGERKLVERHSIVGEQILAPIEFLADVLPLVRGAHERWDGEGYPDGLVGDDIPLGARIIFACDAYDAMTSERPYRPAMSSGAARGELRRVAGSQLDPTVVEALLAVLD